MNVILALATSFVANGQDPWRITVDSPEADGYYGVTVANGQVGVFSSPDPLKTARVILGGVYDIYGSGRIANFVPGIRMLDVEMKFDGTTITRKNITDYRQTLDMRNGQFVGSFAYNKTARVEYRYMALRHMPFSMMLTCTITPLKDCKVTIDNIITADEALKDAREYTSTAKNPPYVYNIASTVARTPVKGIEVGASAVIIPDRDYPAPAIDHYTNRRVGVHSQQFTVDLKKGRNYTFSVIGTTVSSVTHHDVRNAVERLALIAGVETPQRLEAKHLAAWTDLWQSDIEIEGDQQSQQDVRNMLYHAYSFLREGSGLSVSPMGLSGFGYNGHIFWDAETWVYPALLLMHPELAESMLDYRYRRLDAAKMNAYALGYCGALFPWESAAEGGEDTPAHNLYGGLEVHISADIALAAWQYYQVTKDIDWLRAKGWPLISETADFWVSRYETDPDGSLHIRNIIGADEWGVNPTGGKNVDDNAYTIGCTMRNIEVAQKAAAELGQKANPQWQTLADGLHFEMMPEGVIREHSTYSGETTKQADVSLLAYPLELVTDDALMRRNLEYYIATVPRKRTPAMSKSIYSILYSRLGETDKAWEYFQDSYLPNLNPPFRVIAEFDGGTNPYFITGAGGTLQSILMGFGGLRITDDGVRKVYDSRLPKGWKSLTLKGIGANKETYTIK